LVVLALLPLSSHTKLQVIAPFFSRCGAFPMAIW
jgi:hypothetical protein